jgi:hypothetical protein
MHGGCIEYRGNSRIDPLRGLGTRLKDMTEFRPRPMVNHRCGSFDQYLSSAEADSNARTPDLARDGQLAVFHHCIHLTKV